MNRNNISGFNVIGWMYREGELEFLEKYGHVREIGQQIILSTYSALECYLIDKFKEYFSFKFTDIDTNVRQKLLKQINSRSLEDIKNNYYDYLNIHLPSYDIEINSDEKSSFQPKDSWTALRLLSQTRNEIAHQGASKTYKVTSLLDAWYPFEFVREWVHSFDVKFDKLIYDNSTKYLPQSYLVRVEQLRDK